MARAKKKKASLRNYDPRESYVVGERVEFAALGVGTVTDVLSWATPPNPERHSLVVTLDDGRLVHFAAGMGDDEFAAVDMSTTPAALPPGEAAADADLSLESWRAVLARLIGQELPVPGSRKHVYVKTLSGDDVVVVAGRGTENPLPWRGLEVSHRRLREHGQMELSDLETQAPDVDASLLAALLMPIPGITLEGKPPVFYYLDALERDEETRFAVSLRPVNLSKSFVSIPNTSWPDLPMPPLGEHVYILVVVDDTFTSCRLSHRDSPEEVRLYLRGEAGQWLRDNCQEDDDLQIWPLRNSRGDAVALAVEK